MTNEVVATQAFENFIKTLQEEDMQFAEESPCEVSIRNQIEDREYHVYLRCENEEWYFDINSGEQTFLAEDDSILDVLDYIFGE